MNEFSFLYYFLCPCSGLKGALVSILIISVDLNFSLFLLSDICCFALQVHIVQRGAVRPLIEMLHSSDVQLKEMSAFALGRLAQVIIVIFSAVPFQDVNDA